MSTSGSTANRPPHVTVVIPTFNRRERLHRVLESLARQDVSGDVDVEVVVVSDGSTDGTDEYLKSGVTPIDVVAVTQPNGGPAAARNAGLDRACGELIVFVDDDVVADPGLLRAHVDAHERLGPDWVVIGPMLNPDDHDMSPWIAWEQEMLTKQYDAMAKGWYHATMRQFYTGNASVRAAHLAAVEGFDPTFRRAEDVELAYRLDDLGLSFHFEPHAIGLHYAERSYESWRQTAFAYGRNDVIFARDLHRDYLYDFIHEGFQRNHWAIRLLVRSVGGRERRCASTLRMLERSIQRTPVRRSKRLLRHALSAVYAIEYHRGVATELGSRDAYTSLMRHGEPC